MKNKEYIANILTQQFLIKIINNKTDTSLRWNNFWTDVLLGRLWYLRLQSPLCRLVNLAVFFDHYCQATMPKDHAVPIPGLFLFVCLGFGIGTSDSMLIVTTFTFLSHIIFTYYFESFCAGLGSFIYKI